MKKEKLNIKMLKSSSGITLIALVVTIIVLLILAGVSINIVLGENGIFSKAQDSKYTMEKAVLKDKIETLIVNWKADNIVDNSVTEERFWEDLEKAQIIDDKKTDVSDPISSTEPDGTKKDIYEIETTDGYTVEIIVTEEPDGEIHISIGDMELNTSAPPKIYIKSLEADETSITVSASVRRLNGGKITYLYREQGTENWTEIKKDTTDLTATITGLTTGKIYEVKVYAKNSNGEAETSKSIITGDLKTGTITETITWSNEKANVTLTTATGLTIQYQIDDIDDKKWENYENSGITGLKNGQVIYARLTNGISVGNYITIVIKDDKLPQTAKINSQSSYNITSGTTISISATVTHTDNESGVDIANCKWIINNNSTKIGTEASSYTETFSSNGQKISKTVSKGTYYIHVLTVDNVGNKIETVAGPITVIQKVTGISLNKTSATILEGETVQLIATLTPNSADNKNVNWSSSDTSVATVSSSSTASGTAITVTAKGGGTATITATAADGSGKKANCSLTVTIDPSNYTWTQSKTTVTGTHKKVSGKIVTYEVGETYIYNAGVSGGYTGNWGILGAGVGKEKGKLLIMTTSNVVDSFGLKGKTGDGTSNYTAGYNNGIEKLNEVCSQKCGTGARSINADDINRVTGFDPRDVGDGKAWGSGDWHEYGNVVTFTSSSSTASNGMTKTGEFFAYYHPDGRTIGVGESTDVSSITETCNYYSYELKKLLSTSSKAYKMLVSKSYWVGTQEVNRPYGTYAYYGLFTLSINSYLDSETLWDSCGKAIGEKYVGIRAVVFL